MARKSRFVEEAHELLLTDRPRRERGVVYLVGAGPGDPELLTLRAVRRIREAQVAVYDHLVSDAVLSLLPKGCERIYAGKERGNHALPQEEINKLLVALARNGSRVVRAWCASRVAIRTSLGAAARRRSFSHGTASRSKWSPASRPRVALRPTLAFRSRIETAPQQ